MKKIIVFILGIYLCLTSCSSLYSVTANMNYDVCYPDTTITYDDQYTFKVNANSNDISFVCKDCQLSDYINKNYIIYARSIMGTNYLTLRNISCDVNANLFSSTAPIRINSFYFDNIKKIKRDKKNPYKSKEDLKFMKETK